MRARVSSRVARSTTAAILTGWSILATALESDAQSGQPIFERIALSGEAAPGTAAGVVFTAFAGPRLDANHRVGFYASLAGNGVSPANDQGIWSQASGSLGLVARTGSPAPGTRGAVFSNLFLGSNTPPALGVDSAGKVHFMARIAGGDVCDCNNGVLDNDSGWWSNAGGALALVARADSQVPGLATGVLFDTIVGPPIVAANGASAQLFVFKGAGVGLGNGQGIMSGASAALALIARAGDPAPGLPAGTSFGFFGRPFVDPSGATSFFASLAGAGVTPTNDDSLWAERANGLSMIVRQGDPAPGGGLFGNPSVLSMFTNMSIRGGDKLAFSCLLSDGGSGIFSDASGNLESVVRSGEQAPGLPAGTQFKNFGSFSFTGPIQLSVAGHVAFLSGLYTAPPSDASLWLSSPSGGLRLVARGGDAPPGAPPGVTFGTIGFVPIFGSLAFNASGAVAFDALLAGPGFSFGQRGLYATDATGTLRKIVQPGDVIDVSGAGDLRTVANVSFNKDGASLEQYNGTTFSDDGTIVVRLVFSDGSSGVFSTKISPLPPSVYCQAKVNSQGCTPAINWTGSPSASSASSFTIEASSVLNNKNGILFYGTSGPAAIPFQGGLLCAGPPIIRTPVQSSAGNPPPDDCSGSFSFDFNVWVQGGNDPQLGAGSQVNAQYWSRDPAARLGAGLSDALEFTSGH